MGLSCTTCLLLPDKKRTNVVVTAFTLHLSSLLCFWVGVVQFGLYVIPSHWCAGVWFLVCFFDVEHPSVLLLGSYYGSSSGQVGLGLGLLWFRRIAGDIGGWLLDKKEEMAITTFSMAFKPKTAGLKRQLL